MAISDILNAINEQATKQIQDMKSAHSKQMTALREAAERDLARRKQEIMQQKEVKNERMRTKAVEHGRALKRNMILLKKKELLDEVYAKLTKELCSLPAGKVESFLESLMKGLPKEGTIHPAKAHAEIIKKIAPKGCEIGKTIDALGGFIFENDTQERDFTFEHIVDQNVRPSTEVMVANSLFASL